MCQTPPMCGPSISEGLKNLQSQERKSWKYEKSLTLTEGQTGQSRNNYLSLLSLKDKIKTQHKHTCKPISSSIFFQCNFIYSRNRERRGNTELSLLRTKLKKREQTNNCLSWQQNEHFKVLPSKASRDSRFECLFLLGHMQELWQWQAKGGHGNPGEGSDPLKAMTLSSRRHQKHPDPSSCNSLLLLWPFLLILLPTPTHGYQSHKLCEEEEELTVLYPAKI